MRWGNFLATGFGDDLWDIVADHRDRAPVLWVPELEMFCVFGYREVRTALLSPEFTVEYPFRISRQVFGETLLDIDGPRHNALRRRLASLISGREGNSSFVDQLDSCVTKTIGDLEEYTEIDFISEVARALPRAITAAFLGLHSKDQDWVLDDVAYLVRHLDGSSGSFELASRRSTRLQAYVRYCLAEEVPVNQTVLGQLRGPVLGGELDVLDAIGLIMLLFAAGVETSTGLLANTMFALSRNPAWRVAAIEGTVTWEQIVLEALRWEPPQMDTVRFARVDTTLAGVSIAAGQPLKLIIGSANRDPVAFADPAEYQPDRSERRALSFGHGRHSCLGMHLAIQVGVRFLEAFYDRYPYAEAIGPVPPIEGGTFRMPSLLLMALGPTKPGSAS